MAIYQFGVVAQGVRDALAMCPTVTARVDHKALRKAVKDFHAAFPNSKNLRDAVAHPEDKSLTLAHAQKHDFTGPHQSASLDNAGISAATMTSVVVGRRLTETWKGKVFQYELSEATLKILRDVAKAIFAAFPRPL
jgi:hypothetical protein